MGKTTVVQPCEESVYEAENVILAMPRHSLEQIEWDQWEANDWLRANLKSVLIQNAFKLVCGYDNAWWRPLGLEAGRSMTDLPIRQTLYFGSQKRENLLAEKSLLMVSYSDITTVPFWKGLEAGKGYGAEAIPYQASAGIVEEAHAQVVEMHGQRSLPKPYAAAYMDWSQEPFGGAWHTWKGGFKYNEIMPRMRHPVPGENVFICGEAYSNDQGWAEGALETAELLLKNDLKVPDHECSQGWQPDMMRRTRY